MLAPEGTLAPPLLSTVSRRCSPMDHHGHGGASGAQGGHTMSARDVLTGALERYLEQRQENGGSANRISLNTILTPEQLAHFERMQASGQLQLRRADLNHDGVIDVRDLPLVLEALSGTGVNDLPPRLRDSLLRAADTNGDGEINQGDIEPMVQSLVGSTTGRAILDRLRRPDGTYDPRGLAQVFSQLVQLGHQPPTVRRHRILLRTPLLLSSLAGGLAGGHPMHARAPCAKRFFPAKSAQPLQLSLPYAHTVRAFATACRLTATSI